MYRTLFAFWTLILLSFSAGWLYLIYHVAHHFIVKYW